MSTLYTTLITVEQLEALQASGAPLMVFDCSFELMNPAAGEDQYRQAHIPGAVYAHLDHHLSDKLSPDASGHWQPHPDAASGGRHPLPSRERFAAWLSSVGFANTMQAVVYDRQGANYCGRLWWFWSDKLAWGSSGNRLNVKMTRGAKQKGNAVCDNTAGS